MSTRGWYEYYTINPASKQITLSLQFYKWGDATPGNALCEWEFFAKKINETEGRLPIYYVDDMLRQQLVDLYASLPENFSVAIFLFMLQRAREESRPLSQWRWKRLDMPLEQRPDYRLGYAIGNADFKKRFSENSILQKYFIFSDEEVQFKQMSSEDVSLLSKQLEGDDAVIFNDDEVDSDFQKVKEYALIGEYIRPWKNYGLMYSVLDWIQYLTQVTLEVDMGSICGDQRRPRDCYYIYRFFTWLSSEEPFKIEKITMEFCDGQGEDLFLSPRKGDALEFEEEKEYRQEIDQLLDDVKTSNIELFSLNRALEQFQLTPDNFWGTDCYEYPSLIGASQVADGTDHSS
ncbi:hypothetical protein MTBBW1_2010011 [Desulfamplus magnetovallimortis]|uniref:Uncharacterized protein n=1 Tax=Desulfamplus magnetovallimortis TaxID=1246637 RepID=A0A1W1HBX2_9BACT|nr:hypothetical protein [Desulfamplus magnetovallimortis]SLM29902.1 hypothetical protein MTBBW1_2010011 [Desulfamplus magnetovallimortis]